jgi:acyl-CoA synthetase (AMP-forming)/AMP-acid ligase II
LETHAVQEAGIEVDTTWNASQNSNVASALSWQAERQPVATAIHFQKKNWLGRTAWRACSYQELDSLSNAYARGLHAYGIGPGTRTALMLRPGLDFFAVFFALFKAGAVPVLIDPGIGKNALKQCLEEAAPQAFIGITRAQLARKIFGWARKSCKHAVTAGPKFGLGGISLKKLRLLGERSNDEMLHQAEPNDMAAILFTSGSTGAPKGVVYRHRHFVAQVELLRNAFGIEPGEVSLPTFPPFALFDPALGMTTVVPPMDPTRPAEADPGMLLDVIERFKVTTLFGSPALLDRLSGHCVDRKIRIETLTRVISAGAAVPVRIVRQMQQSLFLDAKVHTPYGATECLPVSSISGQEIDERMVDRIESGDGVCVGKPIEPNQVRIIRISEMPFTHLSETTELPFGMPGEIVVTGPTCTDSYWQREADTEMAKLVDDEGRVWHRMGDVGMLDGMGRLWYCGRVSQRVETAKDVLFADQCEAIFNQHPDLLRSAVVGVGDRGRQTAVLCVEIKGKLSPIDMERVHFDLLQLAQAHSITREIRTVLFHPGFPVDIRHNSKIGREELAAWAADQIKN